MTRATLSQSQLDAALLGTLHLLADHPAAAACVTSLAASPGSNYERRPGEVDTQCLLAFPSLEVLDPGPSFALSGSLEPVWQLTRLTHLSLHSRDLSGDWAGIARLSQLQHLDLSSFDLAAVVPALPALASTLTSMVLHDIMRRISPVSWAALAQLDQSAVT